MFCDRAPNTDFTRNGPCTAFPGTSKSSAPCEFCGESGYETERGLTFCRCGYSWSKESYTNDAPGIKCPTTDENDPYLTQKSTTFGGSSTIGMNFTHPFDIKQLTDMEKSYQSATILSRTSPSPGPPLDLGYHTLVSNQTPTSNRDGQNPNWKDINMSTPFGIDLSALSCCPRSSPRPQLPKVPPPDQYDKNSTSTSKVFNFFNRDLTPCSSYKGKKLLKPSPFDKLPDSTILKIFTNLSSASLCQVARVCRKWHVLAWHPSLWQIVTMTGLTGENSNADRAVKQIFRLIGRGSGTCQYIHKLNLSGCYRLTDKGLTLVARKCPELRSLVIKNCSDVSNHGIFEVVSSCNHLDNLDVTGCHRITSIGTRANNTYEQNTQIQLALQFLDLTDCFNLLDDGVRIIVENCPHLLHLYLRRCSKISDISMKYISSYCLLLRELSISDCILVTDFGLYELAKLGPNLRYLSIAKCDRIKDTGVKSIARHCYKLRYLNIRGCEGVSDDALEILSKSCLRLRALDVGKCDITDNGLNFIAKSCPNLKKLSVKSCDMVTDAGIKSIAYFCRGLQQLNIQDCQITLEGYRTVKKFCRKCIIEHTNPGFF